MLFNNELFDNNNDNLQKNVNTFLNHETSFSVKTINVGAYFILRCY